MTRKILLAGATGLLLATGMSGTAIARTGGVTPLAGCGANLHPSVSGGEASWHTTCAHGVLRVQGQVIDTRPDGRCAQVFGTWGNGNVFRSVTACGWRNSETWDRTGRTRSITLRLRTIDG